MALKINGIRVAGLGAHGRDGAGVVEGGTQGQVLTKKNDIDYDTEWTDLPAIDATLSMAGQVAEAKTVGDQISTKQDKITGTAGDFVMIGSDGNTSVSSNVDCGTW